jgi:hypothetical protein
MNMRRKSLSGALVLAGTAAQNQDQQFPRSAAEQAAKAVPAAYQYAPGNVRRYGVIANNPNAATIEEYEARTRGDLSFIVPLPLSQCPPSRGPIKSHSVNDS